MSLLDRLRSWREDPKAFTLAVGITVVLLGIGHFVWLGEVIFPVDDAYITQRNARFLFSGHDPAWPDATPLHGTTSVIHVVLIALVALVLPVQLAQCSIAIIASALYAMGLVELSRTYSKSRALSLALATTGLLTARVIHQLLNGLETGLTMAAIIWILISFRWSARTLHLSFPILCGLIPFVRPELAALSLVLSASWMAHRARLGPKKGVLYDCGRLALYSAAGSLPFIALLMLTTDSPFPTTVEVKRAYFAQGCLPFSAKLNLSTRCLWGATSLIGPLTIGILVLPFSSLGWALLVFAFTLVGAYVWRFPGAMCHYGFRYLFVFVPLLLAAIAEAATSKGIRKWAGIAIGASALVYGVISFGETMRFRQERIRYVKDDLEGVADWLRRNVPAGSTILVHDAGYVAGVPDLTFVDLVGLKSPASFEAHQEATWPTCGRARHIANDVIARLSQARYFVVLKDWEYHFNLLRGLRARGWELSRVDKERGDVHYQVFMMNAPPHELSAGSE